VHRGHRFLINNVVKEAASRGLLSTVVTFDRHPRQVLGSDFQPRLLSTNEEKMLLLSKTGVERCVMLPFSEQMAQMTACDFMKKILHDRLGVQVLIIGYDNRFGHNRSEGFDDYVRYGREMGIEVMSAQSFLLHGINVSSSVIRSFLQEGEIEMAENCLGYPYFFTGKVVKGFRVGHELGFPTANIEQDNMLKMIPSPGVYAVKVRIEGTVELKHAMMNIGTRPTFNGTQQTLEVHILNFNDDIYGKMISVAFVHKLRNERQFASKEALSEQLVKDAQMVEEQFEKDIEE
jgi:riboflavin kinase/FMN adenylyltransferase